MPDCAEDENNDHINTGAGQYERELCDDDYG